MGSCIGAAPRGEPLAGRQGHSRHVVNVRGVMQEPAGSRRPWGTQPAAPREPLAGSHEGQADAPLAAFAVEVPGGPQVTGAGGS